MIIRGGTARATSLDELLDPALRAAIERVDVRSRKVFPGKMAGERRSKQRGRSVEFADHREYTPGDDIRFIDWNVYARVGRLFIKLFVEEQDLAVHIALDASASMDAGPAKGPSKALFAQRLGMALGHLSLVNRNRVSVTIFGGDSVHRLSEMRGRSQTQRLARFLIEHGRPPAAGSGGATPPGARAAFNEALRSIAAARRGAGVMIVISDFLVREGYEPGLRALAAGLGRESGAAPAFDTWCIQTLSPGELDPEREGDGASGVVGDVALRDIETGEAREVTVTAALLAKYRENLDRYLADLSAFCAARGMSHLLVPCDADLERLLLDTLRRRGLLR